MQYAPGSVIGLLWLCWIAYWAIAARSAKATIRQESAAARALHVGPLLLCALLLAVPHLPPAWLESRFLPHDLALRWVAVALTALGLAFSVSARRHLGGNWSGAVVLKKDHHLIRSGPYRIVRHPIYSGLLLALIGTAILVGEWRALIAIALAFAAFVARVRAEDALMEEVFGAEYRDYRRHTPALVPFVA
jgi:protein-S-isoprenylcysteine O-methyltransferase Ste14